jgi:nucleotide-binding universal stress UspA family protein
VTMKAIIAGADGSDQSLRAIEWATEEAARRGLPLHIVFAETPWFNDTPVGRRGRGRIEGGGARPRVRVRGGEPAEGAIARDRCLA